MHMQTSQIQAALQHARSFVLSGDLPCAAIAVSDGDGLHARVAYRADGEEDPTLCNGQFALASISKAITGVLVARLCELGVLDYETPIVDYVPAFGTSAARRSIRLGQIFNHSTGMQSRFVDSCAQVDYDTARLLEVLCTEELVDEPGTRSRYSTHTYQLINAAIQARLGLTMQQALTRYLTMPCGMTATSYYPDAELAVPVVDHPVSANAAFEAVQRMEMSGGGLWSTLDDLQALGRAWLTPGELVSAETLAKATAVLPGLPMAGNESVLSRRTLGWNRERIAAFPGQPESGFFHGGATGTLLYMDPARSLVFVFLTSRWGAGNDQAFGVLNHLYS